jgi:hypothetical protein
VAVLDGDAEVVVVTAATVHGRVLVGAVRTMACWNR